MNIIKILESAPKLHSTPLAVITCESPEVIVELDDENESRIRLIFLPYQGIKITTADCFICPGDKAIFPQRIIEVQDSSWINELREAQNKIDYSADFMNKSRHFIIPVDDDFLEVVAWNIRIETV